MLENEFIRFFIPDIGSKIILGKDWRFDLYSHPDNITILKAMGLWKNDWNTNYLTSRGRWREVVWRPNIPKGTIMTVKSITVRPAGPRGFSSVKFAILKGDSPNETLWKTRFWSSLSDANKIICLLPESSSSTTMREVKLVESRFSLVDIE